MVRPFLIILDPSLKSPKVKRFNASSLSRYAVGKWLNKSKFDPSTMASTEGLTRVNKAAFNVSIFYVKLCHKCQMIGEERRAPRRERRRKRRRKRDHMFV